MPASVRLLQKVKEAWGEEVTQDLVTWVNEGQAVNRAELRELANVYFARFSDRLEERVALSETRFDARLNERISASEARLNERLGGSETALNERINHVETSLNERISHVETSLNGRISHLETSLIERIARSEKGMIERIAGSEKGLIERITGCETRLDTRITSLQLQIARVDGKLDAGLATLRADFAGQMRDQMKWMFVFWAGTIVPLAGLIVALGKGWL